MPVEQKLKDEIITWYPVDPTYVNWEKRGVNFRVAGTITFIDLEKGERTYQDKDDCGLIDMRDLQNEETLWRVVLDKPRLKDLVKSARVGVGDIIGIKYVGDRESKSGSKYKDFQVHIATRRPAETEGA